MDGTILNKKYNLVDRIKALEEGGGGGGYVLPVASDETLGGVKVGNGLEINPETGVLSNTNPTPYTPVAYSTTEQATGEKWIDGKDIYQKTYEVSGSFTLSNDAWTTIISDSNINKLINVQSINSDGTVSDGRLRWHLDSGNVQAAAISPLNLADPVITIYYTKTSVQSKGNK